MKTHLIKLYVFLLFFTITSTISRAQDTITKHNHYAIGLVIYNISTGTGSSFSPGLKRGPNAVVPNNIYQDNLFNHNVYPNAVSSKLNLKLKNANLQNMSLRIYDIEGEIVQQQTIRGFFTEIEISELDSGYYYLEVLDNNNTVGCFRIVKY